MKTKLEDIARKYANTKSHSTGSKFVDCMEDYTAGFTEASEQSNQAIQELVQALEESNNTIDTLQDIANFGLGDERKKENDDLIQKYKNYEV